MKTIVHPVTGRTVKLGRTPSPPMRHLQLRDYLTTHALIPSAPAVCHYSPLVEHGLAMVLGNDTLGDCTAAAAAHLIDQWRGNALSMAPVVTEADTVAFYSRTCGYVPGNEATDQGGNLVDVMTKWRDGGFFADGSAKIEGWAAVDASNVHEVMSALWLFEGLYMGASLPDAWLNPIPSGSGFDWRVAGDPNPSNGHCTAAVGYNGWGLIFDTWGMIGTIEWAALAKYWGAGAAGELYALLSPETINRATKKAASGFDIDALRNDLAAFAA